MRSGRTSAGGATATDGARFLMVSKSTGSPTALPDERPARHPIPDSVCKTCDSTSCSILFAKRRSAHSDSHGSSRPAAAQSPLLRRTWCRITLGDAGIACLRGSPVALIQKILSEELLEDEQLRRRVAPGAARRAAPGLLERPPWSNDAGQPVSIRQPPARGGGWRPTVSSATASDGWQYGSVFK